MLSKFLYKLGLGCLNSLYVLGDFGIFIIRTIISIPSYNVLRELCNQIYILGYKTISIIVISGVLAGMVLSLQIHNVLLLFGTQNIVGQVVGLISMRELAPVLTALFYAGRAGSSLTAEIGHIKITNQLDALYLMGYNPMANLIAIRFWAGFISAILLCFLFIASNLIGSAFMSVDVLQVLSVDFWSILKNGIIMNDLMIALKKIIIFSFVINLIAIYYGLSAKYSSKGISDATTKSVVYASLWVIFLDLLLTGYLLF